MTSFDDGSSPGDDIDTSRLLPPDESLDDEELGGDLDAGYSPAGRPRGSSDWGITAQEASSHEDLEHRLAREEPEQTDTTDGDGIGDTSDTDGEPIDDQVGDVRSGRLVASDIEASDPSSDYFARDVGIDGAGASAEEAAIHTVPDDEDES